MMKKSKKILLLSSLAVFPIPVVSVISAVSCNSNTPDTGDNNDDNNNPSQQTVKLNLTTLYNKLKSETSKIESKDWNQDNQKLVNAVRNALKDATTNKVTLKEITNVNINESKNTGSIIFIVNQDLKKFNITKNSNVVINKSNNSITINNLSLKPTSSIPNNPEELPNIDDSHNENGTTPEQTPPVNPPKPTPQPTPQPEGPTPEVPQPEGPTPEVPQPNPDWNLGEDNENTNGDSVNTNVTFVSKTDINNIDNAIIYPNTAIKPYIRQLIKDNKNLFFNDSISVNESVIDNAVITVNTDDISKPNSQIKFQIQIGDQEPKVFVINNITFAQSTYQPIPDPNNLFVKNNEIDCIDIPPTPNRYADEQFWVKGLIARNKGWFFSDPNIPNSVIVNSTIKTSSSSCIESKYCFSIKATYQSKIYNKNFTLKNLNLCEETYEGQGKLVIKNNPNGYTTLAPALTKETAILENSQITNPAANYLKLDVWSKSNDIDKFSVDLSTNAKDVFVLDATGFCNPKPLTWEIAPEDADKGFTLVGNKLANTKPLIDGETQSVRLVSTISENGKQTKHVDITVSFHLGLAQPTQPAQPNETGTPTNVPTALKPTWAVCQNHSHVEKGVKVDINHFVVEALTEYESQQDLSFILNESADKVFDLTGTNFTNQAKVEWSIKDPDNSVFVILNKKEGKIIENFAPIIGAEGLSTIVRAKIVEPNKASKYVDISLTFRGNGPCEARPRLDFNEIAIAAENEDYFVLPGKNADNYSDRITIPTTSNHGIVKKYGNAPLPWKDDNDLTDEDLTNMFNYLAINDKWGVDLSFGQRKIETNRLANIYFQWLRTTWWKYFPYYSFANPNRIFSIKTSDDIHVMKKIPNLKEWVNDKKWYVDSMQKGTYASEWLKDSKERNDFFNYIQGLLTQIRPGMSDLDKFFTCWRYLDNWTAYSKSTPTGVASEHTGVCIDYASNLALLLNIAGIDAVPDTCGEDELGMRQNNEKAESHGMTFAYLDLGNGKQWYGSDPTFSDSWGSTNISSAKAPSAYENTKVMLYSLADNTNNHPTNGISYQQYFGNQFFGLPWNYIWNQNSTIGTFSTEDFNWDTRNEWINNTLPEEKKIKISNPIYNNGRWYFFKKGINESRDHFVSTKGLFDNNYVEFNGLPSSLVFKDSKYRPLLLNAFNNWALFCAHNGPDSNNNVVNSIALVKMTDSGFDFDNIKYIPIPVDVFKDKVLEFYITLDGNLYVFGTDNNAAADPNVHVVINLKTDYSDIWNLINYSDNNQPSDILDVVRNYYFLIAGVYQIGDKNGQVKINVKKKYFSEIDRIYKDKTTTSNWQKIKNFEEQFKIYTSGIKKSTNSPFIGSVLNEQYFVSRSIFDCAGINLGLYLYVDPSMINNNQDNSNNIIYEFSYKKDGSDQFVPVGNKVTKPKISNKDFIKAGFNKFDNGTLKVKYYPELHMENAIEASTRIIFTDDVDTTAIPFVGFYDALSGIQQSNYLPNIKGWENKEIVIKFNDLGLGDMLSLKPTFTVKRINPSNMKIETIRANLNVDEMKIFEIDYRDVSNENHGIYWLEINGNYNGQSIKLTSCFTFIFTPNDVDENFNSKIWIDAINKITSKQ